MERGKSGLAAQTVAQTHTSLPLSPAPETAYRMTRTMVSLDSYAVEMLGE
jgi:hypothetical protein